MFRKKKRMIDIGELQRKGKIRSPEFMPRDLETNKDGFVEVDRKKEHSHNESVDNLTKPSSSGYIDVNPSKFSTESQGYSKREVDSKIQQLDSIIYKLEQRIELLERKAGINNSINTSNPSNASSGSLIGW